MEKRMTMLLKKNIWMGLTCIALLCGPVFAADPTTKPAAQAADQSAPKMGKNGIEARFLSMHESFLKRGRQGKIGVLFLGDSITEGWNGRGKDVWTKSYSAYDPANFGIGGDRTQHVLWRIENGELDGISPKVLVLMIGTNNVGSNPASEIATADIKIVDEIHEKLPNTKVLLLGIFPRDADAKSYRREQIKAVNAELAKLEDGKNTRYLDISNKFLAPDGTLSKDIMPDLLHPNASGYQIWADSMQPLLDEMMK